MNYEDQISQIRKQKHDEYLKYISNIESEDNDKNQQQTNEEYLKCITKIESEENDKKQQQKKIEILANLRDKYFSENILKNKAATKIQKFIKKNYFGPPCINNNEIPSIPAIYRLRIFITNHHINEYSEENVHPNIIGMHRVIYNMVRPIEKIIYFRYCFDIRKLYPVRHQIIELYDHFYFMQPEDHIKINSLWRKVNGETSESIRFMSSFEYYKSLSVDMYKNSNNNSSGSNMDNTKKQIEDILDKNESNNNLLVEINLDNEYLDALTRQYINNLEQ